MLQAIGRVISLILGFIFWGVILALLGVMLMGSFWLDGAGVERDGQVASKTERITFNYASWTRTFEIGLVREGGPMADVRQALIRNDSPEADQVGVEKVRVSSDVYDRYQVGETVKVKVQPAGFFKNWVIFPQVRLESQSTYSIAYGLYESSSPVPQFLLSLLPAAFLGWLAHRKNQQIWWVSGVFTLLAAVYWLTPLSDRPPHGEVAAAEGKVVALHLVEEVGETSESSGFEALEPHYIVGVEFKPDGRSSVVAVDRVDASSVSLKEGSPVRVEYQRDDPRRAVLSGAGHSWWWWNILSVAQYGVILAGLWIGWWLIVQAFKMFLRGVRAS